MSLQEASRSNHPEFSPFTKSGELLTSDLQNEIQEAKSQGYDVSIGSTQDEAYESQSDIVEMFDFIEQQSEEFASRKDLVTRAELGGAVLAPMMLRKREHQKRIYDLLEPHRGELILDEAQAWPWHNQRGCATALLTITSAHDLISEADKPALEGLYPTMSGPLDDSVLNYRFGVANSLSGLNLREALIVTGQRFRNKTEEDAAISAGKRMASLDEFLKAPVTPEFKRIVQYCSDSLGIRSRKEEVAHAIESHVTEKLNNQTGRDTDKDEILMMSFGCGTALPMLEVVDSLREQGVKSKLILLDQDPIALASASVLASKMDLDDYVEVHCERLFSKLGRPISMQSILRGRALDVCEDSGLREYLPDGVYRGLTKEAWSNLREGGLMTTGNMNTNRKQPEFLHGLMGWTPQVQMRTIEEGIQLHKKSGIPRDATRIRVTQDGIYTLYYSYK